MLHTNRELIGLGTQIGKVTLGKKRHRTNIVILPFYYILDMLLALFKMIRPVNIVIAMVTLSIGYYLLGVLPLQEIGTFVEITRCDTVDVTSARYIESISWITLILQTLGLAFAIGFAKMPFGGLGNNLFNPALVGRAALLVAFPAQMTTWPKVGQLGSYLDAETGATPLAVMKNAIKTGDASVLDQLPSSLDLFLGNHPDGAGAMGEICALALLLGLAYMLWKKIITWHIPVSIIGTVFVLAGLLHLANPAYADPFAVICSGGLMLGAIFMATDYVTSPMTAKGQLIYGVCIGLLTVVIRNWGAYPEGMSFAILIMNAFTPLINNYVKPKRFGEVPAKQ